MMADYSGIHSEVRYYVPLNKTYEVWNLSVTNNSDKARSLNITGYAEFTNNSNYEQDQVNLQYSQYITKTVFVENRVRQMIHANLDRIEDGKEIDNKDVVNRFIGLAGAPVDSWCGDRGEFSENITDMAILSEWRAESLTTTATTTRIAVEQSQQYWSWHGRDKDNSILSWNDR